MTISAPDDFPQYNAYNSLATKDLFSCFSYPPDGAHRLDPAPFLPASRAEMTALGWDSCDIILVTGDAYVDHPSFGMAVIGRLLESQGFRVGIIAQPDWQDLKAFQVLGPPKLLFGITGGNMDSMVNRYTADRKIRHDDAYTPNAEPNRRPDRAVIVYAQRCRQAYPHVPLILGGIESSLRRIAHYDYWSDQVRRSILLDAKADLLVFGNGERAIVEIAHRLAAGETPAQLTDIRGTAYRCATPPAGWFIIDSTQLDTPGPINPPPNPYESTTPNTNPPCQTPETPKAADKAIDNNIIIVKPPASKRRPTALPARTVIRLPSYEAVKQDPVLYAHTARILHLEANPGNARALIQDHGQQAIWLNPPALPLTTAEMDRIYELPYARRPHPQYGKAKIPAFEMIRFSITLMRGCFGGCSFCSITEHEGRIIQSRSEASVLKEIVTIRDQAPGFTGVISDLGGPTANMYRLNCKSDTIRDHCRRLSCVYPKICKNLNTDHSALIQLYRRARAIPGIKRILIASGLRYDLALESPEYIQELVTHHVGGYLKIAPEHTENGPLSKMMKPGIGLYDRFKALFDQYSTAAGKEQYLIPYFIAAHPGTTDEDMLQLALWLKKNGFRADQVQAFLPSPMAMATAMYYSGKNPLHKISADSETVFIPRGAKIRRLHKAFLRYHDPQNWPLLRDALTRMGRRDLIGNGKHQLVPQWQPVLTSAAPKKMPFQTQHTRLYKKQRAL